MALQWTRPGQAIAMERTASEGTALSILSGSHYRIRLKTGVERGASSASRYASTELRSHAHPAWSGSWLLSLVYLESSCFVLLPFLASQIAFPDFQLPDCLLALFIFDDLCPIATADLSVRARRGAQGARRKTK